MNEEFNNEKDFDKYLISPLFEAFTSLPVDGKHMKSLMKTDIEEKDNKYFVDVDMPGIKKENIKVSVNDGYLNVSYKQEENVNNNNEKKHYIRKERYFGEGERSFYLGDVDSTKVDASLNNGVLNIVVPKLVKEDKANYINIK